MYSNILWKKYDKRSCPLRTMLFYHQSQHGSLIGNLLDAVPNGSDFPHVHHSKSLLWCLLLQQFFYFCVVSKIWSLQKYSVYGFTCIRKGGNWRSKFI